MYDLKLTDTGDIDMSFNTVISRFKLSFGISKYKSQCVSFIVSNSQSTPQKRGITVKFKTNNNDDSLSAFESNHVVDIQEAVQNIRLLLKTELGDTKIDGFGSELYKLKHSIMNDVNLEKIRSVIGDIVRNVFDDDTIDIVVERIDTDGYFYCQSVVVSIYKDAEKIETFIF